jgi:hypothetical protein
MPRLLPLLLLSLLVLAAPASAKPRCPKSTVVIGPKKQPRACLPKTLPAANPTVLKPLMKGKPNRRLEALALRAFRARAAQADGGLPRGVTMEVNGSVVELRNQAGESVSMGLDKAGQVPSCPKADGAVPARYDETFTLGAATAKHGKRTWTLATLRYEGEWTGHVGVGAKAESYDIVLRGELTIRSGVEIASTGKVLKRNPTRTYRAAFNRKAIPLDADIVSMIRNFTVRGPKGTRGSDEDAQAVTGLLTLAAAPLSDIPSELRKGDERWYEQHACAQRDYTWTPEKVTQGGRADWNLWVMAEDGTRVADARWQMSSGCGAISATSASGPTAQVGVVDEAGAWEPGSSGACVSLSATSPAGRIRPVHHSIPAVDRIRYRYDIRVDFKKDMGSGVAQTNATGVGRVTVGPGEGYVDGEGDYFGTEWDSGIGNPCGHDMLRTRAFSSPVVVGAKIEEDRVTIAFTAVHRLFEASWILTLPVTGGEEFYTSFQPFCGAPQGAFHTSTVKVTATPVS